MSTSIYKVEYVCHCGVNYGYCGAKNAVILKSINSTDVYCLYHTDTHGVYGNENPKTEEGGLVWFGDEYLSALKEVINMNEPNGDTLTEQERSVIFKK